MSFSRSRTQIFADEGILLSVSALHPRSSAAFLSEVQVGRFRQLLLSDIARRPFPAKSLPSTPIFTMRRSLWAGTEKPLECIRIAGTVAVMTADEILKTVASMPSEDWLKIQAGIAEMVTACFSSDEVSEIRDALAEADAEFARGEAVTGAEVRRQLGLS